MKTTKDLWHLSFISCLEIREYFGEDKCGDVFTAEEYTKLNKLTKELLSNATDRGNSYANILLAMYNAINDAVYDYELETE